jgi:hypothetical protein
MPAYAVPPNPAIKAQSDVKCTALGPNTKGIFTGAAYIYNYSKRVDYYFEASQKTSSLLIQIPTIRSAG